jgi:hypothetical protein
MTADEHDGAGGVNNRIVESGSLGSLTLLSSLEQKEKARNDLFS